MAGVGEENQKYELTVIKKNESLVTIVKNSKLCIWKLLKEYIEKVFHKINKKKKKIFITMFSDGWA